MSRILDAGFFRLVESFRMLVVATLTLSLFDFDLDAILVGPGVLTDACHLPRNLYIRGVGSDDEAIAFDLFADDGLSEGAKYGQLISEVTI
jgi:hypothetical protein